MSSYIGIDCSTQSLTAVVIDMDTMRVSHIACVTYGIDLPEYESPQGVLANADPLVRRSNPLMWVEALEVLFERLKGEGLDFGRVAGIGGSAQQHGSVYLKGEFLKGDWLKEGRTLTECVAPLLSRSEAPIWMDSSTFDECRSIEAICGGSDYMRKTTGSAATERFAGPQISRFAKLEPEHYDDTGVIHLISSFMCSVLLGTSAPLDYGDASGMNLMSLKGFAWDPLILDATAPDLASRLPKLMPSTTVAGVLHPYFKRFGFRSDVKVTLWSGDNLNSLIGVGGWKTGTAAISLGTSDTYFSAMDKVNVDPEGCGHVFANPAGGYMSLICFKNGSFARERVRDDYGLSWKEFDNDAFQLTPPGNGGCMMLPYFTPEITPLVLNACPFYKGNSLFESKKDASAMVRALVEAQAMSMRIHSGWIGSKPKKLRVTGGASKSEGMCQVFADVFNATVERMNLEDSPSLGAAMRAAQSSGEWDWAKLTKAFCVCDSSKTIKPIERNVEIYAEMRERYSAFEKEITG